MARQVRAQGIGRAPAEILSDICLGDGRAHRERRQAQKHDRDAHEPLERRPRLDLALLLGTTFGVLLLAKPNGALALVLLPASLLVFDWTAPRRWHRLAVWAGFIAIALSVTVCFSALPRLSPLAYS